MALLREKNPTAAILTTPWDQLDGKTILSAIEKTSMEEELLAHIRAEHEAEQAAHAHHHHEEEHGHHHHHHEEHDHACCHGEHHHEHSHHEHEHGEHCHHGHAHEHHPHEHDHGEECACGCHDHEHHGHHADEVFASWGRETVKPFAQDQLEHILTELDLGECGAILRAKGIVPSEGGSWLHFDYVPEEHQVRTGPADYTGRLCVIGADLNEDKLAALFGL